MHNTGRTTLNANEQASLASAVEGLRAEVARLGERVAALEARVAAPAGAAGAAGVTPELISVISAVIAAYLGVKPRIKQIRLVGGASWAQQGRVTIQASHVLQVRHG